MQVIAVDIGNSSTKIAMTVGEETGSSDPRWLDKQIFRHSEPFRPKLPNTNHLWSVSSVNQAREQPLADWVMKNRPNDRYHLIEHDQIPIESNVDSREQVGRDRLIAAFAALSLNDHHGPLIVIDAGTAVTIDLVDRESVFQGGVIYPGAATILKNLSEATAALPDLSDRNHMESLGNLSGKFVGKSTEEAILLGAMQMQIATINHIVSASQNTDSAIKTYATGGGIQDIQSGLIPGIIFVPDLVLRGCLSIGNQFIRRKKE